MIPTFTRWATNTVDALRDKYHNLPVSLYIYFKLCPRPTKNIYELILWENILVKYQTTYHTFQFNEAEQVTSHYLNQWWCALQRHICGTRPRWVRASHTPAHKNKLSCGNFPAMVSNTYILYNVWLFTKASVYKNINRPIIVQGRVFSCCWVVDTRYFVFFVKTPSLTGRD